MSSFVIAPERSPFRFCLVIVYYIVIEIFKISPDFRPITDVIQGEFVCIVYLLSYTWLAIANLYSRIVLFDYIYRGVHRIAIEKHFYKFWVQR